jgi:hypothetical protein
MHEDDLQYDAKKDSVKGGFGVSAVDGDFAAICDPFRTIGMSVSQLKVEPLRDFHF